MGQFRLLRCLLPEDGPGSLNRFFLGQKRVYETSAATPTKANPPKFYSVHYHWLMGFEAWIGMGDQIEIINQLYTLCLGAYDAA